MDQIQIRKYKDEDIDQIIDLLNRNFRDQQHIKISRNINWWNWKYKDNIFGEPVIYVAEINSKIIACRPFWPWELNVRGNNLKCYQPLDSVVDSEYRGMGLFSKMTSKAIKENIDSIDLIFNFPNEQSIGSYTNLGWSFVGNLRWYVKVYNPLQALKLLQNYSGFESIVVDANDRISESKLNDIKVRYNFDEKIKTIRSGEFLSWRYLNHPAINYGIEIIKNKKNKLIFIYEINENNSGREMIVVDYIGNYNLFDEMLNRIDCLSKKYKVAHVMVLRKYNTPSKPFIKRLYVNYRKKNFVVLPINLKINNIAQEYYNWDLFLGMHDSI